MIYWEFFDIPHYNNCSVIKIIFLKIKGVTIRLNDLLLVNEEKMYDAYEIDFDRHWKEVITDFFDDFLLLVEPHLFEKIDFLKNRN